MFRDYGRNRVVPGSEFDWLSCLDPQVDPFAVIRDVHAPIFARQES